MNKKVNIHEPTMEPRVPLLYEKGTHSLWTDPFISENFLKQQLTTDNDLASRDQTKNRIVLDWILNFTNKPKLAVLDLGCGPGLYAESLASDGHSVVGVDISACAISYAQLSAVANDLNIQYRCENYLHLDYVNRFDLIIMVYLEFSQLNPAERTELLSITRKALKKGGVLAFDVMNENYAAPDLQAEVMPKSIVEEASGFWSPASHSVETISYHYPKDKVILNQYTVREQYQATKVFRVWNRYYSETELVDILKESGFSFLDCSSAVLEQYDSWSGRSISFYAVSKSA